MERINRTNALERREQALREAFLSAADGDTRAYAHFLQEVSRHLRAYLRRKLFGYANDIEDIVQEVLLAIHNSRHTYRPDEPVTAWIYAITRYKMADFLRSTQRRAAQHEVVEDVDSLFAAADDAPAQTRRDLHTLLALLPDKQRLPIVHVKLEGHTVAETAQLTGLSESSVKIGIFRGLKALAARIRDSR